MGTVRLWHLKALGYCNRRMRVWCKRNNYSWLKLRKEGIDSDYLLSIDNSSLARNAVDFAAASGWSETPRSADNDKIHGGCV